MSLVMVILVAIGLLAVLGLIAWAVVAFETSRGALSMPTSTDAPHNESRELVGRHAD